MKRLISSSLFVAVATQLISVASASPPPSEYAVVGYSDSSLLFSNVADENRTREIEFDAASQTTLSRLMSIDCDPSVNYAPDDLVAAEIVNIGRYDIETSMFQPLDPTPIIKVISVEQLGNRFALRCGDSGAPNWITFSSLPHARQYALLRHGAFPWPGQGWARLQVSDDSHIYVPKVQAREGATYFFAPRRDGAGGGTFGIWGANCSHGTAAIMAQAYFDDLDDYLQSDGVIPPSQRFSYDAPMSGFVTENQLGWVGPALDFMCSNANEIIASEDFSLADLLSGHVPN